MTFNEDGTVTFTQAEYVQIVSILEQQHDGLLSELETLVAVNIVLGNDRDNLLFNATVLEKLRAEIDRMTTGNTNLSIEIAKLLSETGAVPGNIPPIANAGTQTSQVTGATIQLDGSGSIDPEGSPLFYAWTITTKPTGSTAALSSSTIVNPTFVADLDGSYVVSLTVSDGTSISAPSTVSFIASTTNVAPIANAGSGPMAATVGTQITLDGSGSTDPNGDALTYSWVMTSRPGGSAAALGSANTVNPIFTPDVVGAYVVTLTVSDGSLDNSSALTVNALAVNTAPTAVITPVTNAIKDVLINLSGSSSTDPEGDTLTYLWSVTTRPTGSVAALSSTTSATPTFTPDVAGNYNIRLIVNDGALSSPPATISFNAAATNIKPIANAGSAVPVTLGGTINLSGAASSDPNGDPLTYLWSILFAPAGSTATLSSTTIVNPTLTPDVAGNYTFLLVVNDGLLDSLASLVTYTVSSVPNRAPTAIMSALPATVPIGSPVALTAYASYDIDGDTISYLWTLPSRPAGSSASITGATSVSASFTPDIIGNYSVSLVVNDGLLNSPAVSSSTSAIGAATPFFTDNFDTGNILKTLNGTAFWSNNTSSFQQPSANKLSSITVQTEPSGGYSLRALYAGTTNIEEDARPEIRFDLKGDYTDLWCSFDVFVPANYFHRVPASPANNKFFIIYDANNAYRHFFDLETWPINGATDGSDRFGLQRGYNGANVGWLYPPTNVTLGAPADRGLWHQYVLHWKVATTQTSNDAMFQLWKNGALVMNFQGLPDWDPNENSVRKGYIFGASNSGFTPDTELRLDNIQFSVQELAKTWTPHP